MAETYIPRTDAEALLWMQAFANGIGASPSTYMLAATGESGVASRE